MHPFVTIGIRAARAAGNVITRGLNRLDTIEVETKHDKDFVSEIDRQSEEEIIKIIHRAYPDHAVLAEESGAQGHADYEWIIDPLDGTTNFLHGFPQFAVSIAVRHRGKLTAGVVYDPMLQELFTASQGNGAQLNERRIRVSTRHQMNTALLGTGFPFRPDQNLDYYLSTLKVLMQETAGIRRPGAAALDLAYVAAGRLDGFWEFGLKPWDMAAGALLIQEAGGIVSEPDGKGDFLNSGNLVCGNPKIQQQMLKLIQSAVKPVV
jgi:myo-inositol-1(or 4)-monophosphatase